ncbi:MAG TPA: nuclease-related domain-containing protein [Anaerolineales bacterium]|nr:NERD domain-containing protein [Anaerolineales bacterium]HNS62632.1 nuclease-related domain-containing protein [Anaerolineales bacterium]
MPDFFLIICFGTLGLAVFVLGVLIGLITKNSYRYRVLLNQNRGEAIVRKLITSNFKSPSFHLLNNITIPFQDGTTQIDHILISTKGVFVIEVKHYSGWIFANEKSKQWMQSIYRVKNQFQNPIHQNFRHIKAIQQLLDFLPKEQIHSIVVFSGSAEFKTPVPNGVFYLHQLINHFNSFQDDVISSNRLEFCVGRLECKRYELTKTTDIQHRAFLDKKFGN